MVLSGILFSPEKSGGLLSGAFAGEHIIESIESTFQTLVMLVKSNVAISLLLGTIVYLWIVTIIWVTKDCAKRMKSFFRQIFSILLVTIGGPVVGLPLYIAYRPVHYKEVPMARKEALDLQTTMCPRCKMINRAEHKHCLLCGESIRVTCSSCNASYPYDYVHCPTCGAKQK